MFGDVSLRFNGIKSLTMVGHDENCGGLMGGNRGMEIMEFAHLGHSGEGDFRV